MQATKRTIIVGILGLTIITTSSVAQTEVPDKRKETAQHSQRDHYLVRAYLTGEGVPSVMTINAVGKDLLSLLQNLQKRQPTATLIIESVKYVSKDGTLSVVKDLPYPFNENRDSSQWVSKVLREINQLKSYSFVSGNIYFSGEGFANVMAVPATETMTLYKLYDRSGPGTSITLDACVYKKADGTLSAPMNKSIKLQ